MTPSTAPDDAAPPAARVAGAMCALQSVLLAVTAGAFVLELARGESDEPGVAAMSLVVCLVFVSLLALMAAHWWRGRRWPRTPTIVWSLLLLPTAWTLAGTSGLAVGLAVAAVAVLGAVAAWSSPAPSLPEDTAL